MVSQSTGSAKTQIRRVWFHGFDSNATVGSRAAITTTIYNGYIFCVDMVLGAALVAGTALPSGLIGKGQGAARYYANVCRPLTANLHQIAGVAVNLPPGGLLGTKTAGNGGYLGGCWLDIACGGPADVWAGINVNSYALSFGGTNDSFALASLTVSTAANNQLVFAKPLQQVDRSGTAGPVLCNLEGPALVKFDPA